MTFKEPSKELLKLLDDELIRLHKIVDGGEICPSIIAMDLIKEHNIRLMRLPVVIEVSNEG